MKYFFDLFRTATAEEISKNELCRAKKELLDEQSRLELSAALVGYHNRRIRRLEQYVKQFDEQERQITIVQHP